MQRGAARHQREGISRREGEEATRALLAMRALSRLEAQLQGTSAARPALA